MRKKRKERDEKEEANLSIRFLFGVFSMSIERTLRLRCTKRTGQ